ncbi:hypothetical protein L618_002400000100 [Rhodococcus rhodochrous J45]|uniref:Uncharacterized protein n=1 Tax=Rhodococcus rhodochrous J45 TaxID=935266 RepID=A0A562E326_RHORH|nr:hypothetical protein L618_002400000100 [Rhodococcus rhodochrous J45]
MQSAGGHSHIEVGGVTRDGLQQVQQMKAYDPGLVRVVGKIDVDAVPQVLPCQNMPIQDLVEAAYTGEQTLGGVGRLGDGVIAAGEHGRGLLDDDCTAGLEVDGDQVADPFAGADLGPVVILDVPVSAFTAVSIGPDSGARRGRNRDAGLGGLHRQHHRIGGGFGGDEAFEVITGQIAVAVDEGVANRTVEHGAELDGAAPVLGHHRGLHRADMRQVHGDEAALDEGGRAALPVAPAQPSGQHRAAQIQVLAVVEQLDGVDIEPLPVVDAEGQR